MDGWDVATNKRLMEKTPTELVHEARRRMATSMPADVWQAVFAAVNDESICAWGYDRFFDQVLGQRDDRVRFEMLVILGVLHRSDSEDDWYVAMTGWDPFVFIHNWYDDRRLRRPA